MGVRVGAGVGAMEVGAVVGVNVGGCVGEVVGGRDKVGADVGDMVVDVTAVVIIITTKATL